MIEPSLCQFAQIEVELTPAHVLGEGRGGLRKIIPIVGGQVTGQITGRVLNVGADWQTVHSPELAHLDARYALETDDGAIIEIHNRGFRHTTKEVADKLIAGEDVDPSQYYFRTLAMLETGHESYSWLNTRVFVGSGRRDKDGVIIDLYLVE